jgi:hypothetical protein
LAEPKNILAEPGGSAEPRLKNTGLDNSVLSKDVENEVRKKERKERERVRKLKERERESKKGRRGI